MQQNLSLKASLGLWTEHHSKYGVWRAYSLSDFTYELYTVDSMDLWRVHHIDDNILFTESTITFEAFDPSLATPMFIQSFDEGTEIESSITSYICSPRIPSTPSTSWSSLLSCQDDWIQELLEDHKFLDCNTPFEIMELLDQYKFLLTVSDGSVIFHNMSFGWVLATSNGDVIAEGAGPCSGRGNSLRLEGAGMLTVTVFISLILGFIGRDNAKL